LKRASAKWIYPQENGHGARLQRELSVTPLVARILANRGYTEPATAQSFLSPSLDALHDPFLLTDMRAAVERLMAAIARRESILLYGDYDVDGTASVVILKTALDLAGAVTSYHVPNRLRDGYGMRSDVVERAAGTGVKLIVSVDTGIRAGDVVRRARELGIDVIVTDHHLPEEALPPACAVLNPNRADCSYPDKNLCGAGVAFKLVQGLMRELKWEAARVRVLTESFLKLVAIATVADVVPLTGENRIAVKFGLAGLTRVRNPGLRALMEVAGFKEGEEPSAGQVAFRIAPRINAAGRMADASEVIELFLTKDSTRASSIAKQLHDWNAERQQTELSTLEACLECAIAEEARSLVFAGAEWHIGVVGIVASRLVERYHRPVFVLAIDPETGEMAGSGRSIENFHLLDALESMADLFIKFGGHSHAAGVTLPALKLDEFRSRLDAYASGRLSADDLRPRLRIDAEVEFKDLTEDSVAGVLALGPFGQGNPAPVLASRDVCFPEPPVFMKEKHLRVRAVRQQHTLRLKAWNFGERHAEFDASGRYEIAFTIEEDAFSASRGYAPWSASLRDLRGA